MYLCGGQTLNQEIEDMKNQLTSNSGSKNENGDTIAHLKKEDQIRVQRINAKKDEVAPLPGQIEVTTQAYIY